MMDYPIRTCSCGRPTVTPYHDHCATCIRHAKPATAGENE